MPKDETNWLIEYQPLRSPAEFEKGLPLPKFSSLEDKMVIVASGSPRNGRVLKVFPDGVSVVKFPPSLMKTMIREKITRGNVDVVDEKILGYQEPKRAWNLKDGEGDDGNLSLNKARVAAAAMISFSDRRKEKIPSHIQVYARDNNVADCTGHFLDKPGYAIRSGLKTDEDRPKHWPESWVEQGQGEEPEDPVSQLDRLHRSMSSDSKTVPFFVANSTTVLDLDLKKDVPEKDIDRLVDFTQPLPDCVSAKQQNSFMAVKPDHPSVNYFSYFGRSGKPSVWGVWDFYTNRLLEHGGNLLYSIPGIVDWSRPPFSRHIEVSPIMSSLKALMGDVEKDDVVWQRYERAVANDTVIEDEMVGVSTKSLKALLG